MRMTTAAAHPLARADREQARLGSTCSRPRPRRTRTAITVSTRRSDRPSLPASTRPAIRPFAKTATRDTWGHQPTFRGKTTPIAPLGTAPSAQGMSLASARRRDRVCGRDEAPSLLVTRRAARHPTNPPRPCLPLGQCLRWLMLLVLTPLMLRVPTRLSCCYRLTHSRRYHSCSALLL